MSADSPIVAADPAPTVSPEQPHSPSQPAAAADGDAVGGLRAELESVFSKQNLQTDGFLVSHMNAQMCVPMAVVLQLPRVKALGGEEATVIKALEGSSVCTATPEGVKPNIKTERNTIILREIASDTAEDKVLEIFQGEGMAPVKSLRSDVGDTWFVTMASEADAMNTILALRSRTFDSKPIKARLKSENLLRSFFPQPTAADQPGMPGGFPLGHPAGPMGLTGGAFNAAAPAGGMMNGAPFGFQARGMFPGRGPMGFMNPGMAGVGGMGPRPLVPGAGMVAARPQQPKKAGARDPGQSAAGGPKEGRAPAGAAAGAAQPRQERDRSGASSGRGSVREGEQAKGGSRSRGGGARGEERNKGRSDGGGSRSGSTGGDRDSRELLSAANFPPLPGGDAAGAGGSRGGSTQHSPTKAGADEAGYHSPFLKYKQDEILHIVQRMSRDDVDNLPHVDYDAHTLVTVKEANMDLLLRQRSISIDDVREQLRKGRPVHREGVIPGAVDYSSYLYGEGPEAAAAAGGQGSGAQPNDKAGRGARQGSESSAKNDSSRHQPSGQEPHSGAAHGKKKTGRRDGEESGGGGAGGASRAKKSEGGSKPGRAAAEEVPAPAPQGAGGAADAAKGEEQADPSAGKVPKPPVGGYAAAVMKSSPAQGTGRGAKNPKPAPSKGTGAPGGGAAAAGGTARDAKKPGGAKKQAQGEKEAASGNSKAGGRRRDNNGEHGKGEGGGKGSAAPGKQEQAPGGLDVPAQDAPPPAPGAASPALRSNRGWEKPGLVAPEAEAPAEAGPPANASEGTTDPPPEVKVPEDLPPVPPPTTTSPARERIDAVEAVDAKAPAKAEEAAKEEPPAQDKAAAAPAEEKSPPVVKKKSFADALKAAGPPSNQASNTTTAAES